MWRVLLTHAWCRHVMLQRHDLQLALYERANEVGVNVLFGQHVSGIQTSGDNPAIINLVEGESITADIVVGADGNHLSSSFSVKSPSHPT